MTARRGLVRACLLAALTFGAGIVAPASRAEEASPPSPVLAEAYRLTDEKQLDRAVDVLRAHLDREPSDAEARSLLARVLSWSRRFDESTVEYERLLSEHPERGRDHAGFARMLTWAGRLERSLGEFRLALAADSSDVEARLDYARAMSWVGDLPGATMEYRRILFAHPDQGDAWLGYATVARWRSGATASDRFLGRAEAHGAEQTASAEERAAVRHALAPRFGGGWSSAQERQYLAGPDYTLRSSGPYTDARLTIGRAADLTMRAGWTVQFERDETGSLAYDLDVRAVRADLELLRGYPFQAAAGLESRRFTPGAPGVTYPLLGSGDFTGWNMRSWWFLGRLTPALALRRDFVPLKSSLPVNQLRLAHQTVVEGTLAWQWSGRGSATSAFEHGSYSDGNGRMTVRAGSGYRIRIRQPAISLDYAAAYSDYDTTSASYFTPLASLRHEAGIAVDGYTQRFGLSYGAGYRLTRIGSANFGPIRSHAWSAHLDAADLGSLGLGIDALYSRDNNAYEVWSIGIHAAARW